MTIGRRHWVLVLAAVLGIVGGVVTAIVAPGRSQGPGDDVSSFNDPLRLGVPLVDLPCTGEAVLVVGYGDSAAALSAAVTDSDREGVRYLRTDDSCETVWAPREGTDGEVTTPQYVAYAGPAADTAAPCAQRMDGAHSGDNVTILSAGSTEFVTCVCALDTAELMVLDPPENPAAITDTDPRTAVWVRALKDLLADLDAPANGSAPPASTTTGSYDPATVRRVEEFQTANDIAPSGVVNEDTWRALKNTLCGDYAF